jgi:biofilm PGA synthesis N-glycosyltransferase PgaC
VDTHLLVHRSWNSICPSDIERQEKKLSSFLNTFVNSFIFQILSWFLAVFPVLIAALSVNSSRMFLLNRFRVETERLQPHQSDLEKAQAKWPIISVVIPARDEEISIESTVRAATKLTWSKVEVIVVNDGSVDQTANILERLRLELGIKVISHDAPQGKSATLNDGMRAAESEIVLILDADGIPARNVLIRMVPHLFLDKSVLAVTGNPRISNVPNLLSKLQAIEFSSTISTLRRGQSAWGRINTMSGIMSVLRRKEILDLGGFSSEQPTEDIELTWRIHREGYRCIYEPAAQVAMKVPLTFRDWFKQRTRWGSGLVRVLQKHGFQIIKKFEWPVFPLLLEATFAIIWCHLLLLFVLVWLIALTTSTIELTSPLGIGRWGAMAIGVSILQIIWGMHLDKSHDRTITKLWSLAPLYPLFYWSLSAFVVVWTTIPTLLTKPKKILWTSPGRRDTRNII